MKEVNIENGRMVTIDIVKANIFAVVLMIVSGIALLVPYILIWHDQWSRETVKEFFDTFLWRGSLFVILMAVGIVVHELIHGITFACFGFYLLLWSIVFIAAAGGDIWMAWLMTKESPDCTVLDHPSEAGYYVFD